ncbi:hypothetical protein PHMEG_00013460 [Phytophthora megakarya]|uniref:Uncharacterized protein n=1 Tax=Phytophthora megakarya TaxID=4795 RepID=A0A225W6N4_9STRA|nr:hypothetical protein PHMEG_00013460 [Phytophthora megakarya]
MGKFSHNYSIQRNLGPRSYHNGITVGKWSNGFFNCCDDIIPNAFICPVISVAQIGVRLGLVGYPFVLACT